MLNKAIIQGRLVADPELRYTSSNKAVAQFRVAVDRPYKSNGANAQTADFISIVAWGKTAEFISRYFAKGSMILIDGRIQTRDYTDNNGQKRYVTEVVAENINFAGDKKTGGESKPSKPATPASYAPPSTQTSMDYGSNEFKELADDDGELPF